MLRPLPGVSATFQSSMGPPPNNTTISEPHSHLGFSWLVLAEEFQAHARPVLCRSKGRREATKRGGEGKRENGKRTSRYSQPVKMAWTA